MANLRIIARNYVDTCIFSTPVPALATGTDIDNLKLYSRSKVIRTDANPTPGTQEIKGILSPKVNVNAVVFGRHNFPVGMTLRIYFYADSTWTTPTTLGGDSGILTVTSSDAGSDVTGWGDFPWGSIPWGYDALSEEYAPASNFVYWMPDTAANALSFKIVIDVPLEEVEFGRLFIGNYIEPTYNLSLNHNLSWAETTKQYRTDGGTLRSDISPPVRKIEFEMGTIDSADRPLIQQNLRYVGLRKDFFISLFPEDPDTNRIKDYSGIMKLTKVPIMTEFAPLYYKSKYVMEEV